MQWSHRSFAWLGAGLLLTAGAGLGVAFLAGFMGSPSLEQSAHAQGDKSSLPVAAKAGSDKAAPILGASPAREPLQRVSTPQPAQVEPYEQTDIHAKVSGYLESFGVVMGPDGKPIVDGKGKPRPLDIGDRVTQGQVLATLSIPEMKQEVVQKAAFVEKAQADAGQAKAAVQAAIALAAAAAAKVEEVQSLVAKHKAEVKYRAGEHQRQLRLFQQMLAAQDVVDKEENQLRSAEAGLAAAINAVATAQANAKVEQARIIQAQADVKAAEARQKVAQADLKYAEIMADYAAIKAPYDGVLTRRLVDTGAFIQSATTGKATPLFTLARVDRLRIVAKVPEMEAGLVRIGQPANLKLNAIPGQTLAGKVVRIADALDSEFRTMRVEVELEAPPARLRPGMFGSVTFVFGEAAS